MTATFNPNNKTVIIATLFDGNKTVSYTQFYAYRFVASHLHFSGKLHGKILTHAQEWQAYCLCDGFGKMTSEQLAEINGGYDWSHVRDSSDEAILECANYIAKAGNWLLDNVDAIATKHLEQCLLYGLDPAEYV